jgi:hypothetical protein
MISVPNDDADSDDECLVQEDGCCSVETKKITYMRSTIKNEAPAKAR